MGNASFRNRREAGQLLSDQLLAMDLIRPLVFAVPKGGLPVAREIAASFGVPLDVTPGHENEIRESTEFSAVTADHASSTAVTDDYSDNDVIVVDDLIANGAAAIAAIKGLRKNHATRIIVVAPVISNFAMKRLQSEENVEVCAIHFLEETPPVAELFGDDDDFISDDEIRSIADQARKQTSSGEAETAWIDIHIGDGVQTARWRAPEKICGVVIIVNTEGDLHDGTLAVDSVSERLDADGIATLSLTFTEYTEDIASLSRRIRQVSNWLQDFEPAHGTSLAYFGIGFGGAAMLEAAVATPERVKALVCYEAPLQLIPDFVPRVHAPTLLIVKDAASENIEGNRMANERILVESSFVNLASGHEKISGVVEPWLIRFLSTGTPLKKTRPKRTQSSASVNQ